MSTDLKVGDAVECRTAHGDWFPAKVTGAARNVRYGKTYRLAVAITGGGWHHVNWPVEDVRAASHLTEGSTTP